MMIQTVVRRYLILELKRLLKILAIALCKKTEYLRVAKKVLACQQHQHQSR